MHTFTVPITMLVADPHQPRRTFAPDDLERLGQSLLEGQVLPLLVRQNPDDERSFMLIDGERRWRAAQAVGISELVVYERERSDVLRLQLVANTAMPLLPTEQAAAFRLWLDNHPDRSQRDLARLTGISESVVSERLALLALDPRLQVALDRDEISMSVAGILSRSVPTDQLDAWLAIAVTKGVSAERLSAMIAQRTIKPRERARKAKALTHAQRSIAATWGSRVTITTTPRGVALRIVCPEDKFPQLTAVLSRSNPHSRKEDHV